MSDEGARLALEADQLVPKRFYLIISKREFAFDAEVVWRRGTHVGVKFCARLNLSEPQLHFVKTLADELQPRPQSRSAPRAPCE